MTRRVGVGGKVKDLWSEAEAKASAKRATYSRLRQTRNQVI